MGALFTGFNWMDKLLKNGIPYPAHTVISGPGGAGKPIIGAMIANAWLKNGGTLIHLLINFNREYADSLLERFNHDLKNYNDQIVYIEFDPLMNAVEKTGSLSFRANLLKPENLDKAIQMAKIVLPETESPPLIYGSALNMLLFSKSHNKKVHQKILNLMRTRETNTLFAISNNIFEQEAAEWENVADNLFYSHGTGIMQLAFNVLKLNGEKTHSKEIEAPIKEDDLCEIRSEAEKARKKIIPLLRKI